MDPKKEKAVDLSSLERTGRPVRIEAARVDGYEGERRSAKPLTRGRLSGPPLSHGVSGEVLDRDARGPALTGMNAYVACLENTARMLKMASKVADIVQQANELTSCERAKVISQLLKTLDPPGEETTDFEAAWSEEFDRREREMDAGEVEFVDWDALRASLSR
jgi:putative addiction module component (TIGR02574 family)